MALHPSQLPQRPCQLHLITDRLAAPGEFILHSLIANQFKSSKNSRCILVSFTETFSHWRTVASRLTPATNLAALSSTGSFAFIDVLSEFSNLFRSNDPVQQSASLKDLYMRICAIFQTIENVEDRQFSIVLDGLSAVEWIGVPISELKLFVRAVHTVCRKHKASLVIRHRRNATNGLDDMMRSLLQSCVWHLEIMPLASGRSGAVSGEIALHRGPLNDGFGAIGGDGRSRALQYRLSDAGAIYFERGTGAGVL